MATDVRVSLVILPKNPLHFGPVPLEHATQLALRAIGLFEVHVAALGPVETDPHVKIIALQELTTFDVLEAVKTAQLDSRVRIVVGHDAVSGKIASQIAGKLRAKFVLMHHTTPGLYDHNKDQWDPSDTDVMTKELIELTKAADAVVSVGPLIFGNWRQTVGRKPALLYQPLGGGAFVKSDPPDYFPGMLPDVLYVGAANQAEMRSKGTERMAGYLRDIRRGLGMNIKFSIVGAPSVEERRALADFGGPWASVGSMATQAEVVTAMRQATVVVMPSILEPFGMGGLEAMLAGVPTLITADSGLAMWLKSILHADLLERCVARTDDEWKARLGAMLHNIPKALNIATRIRIVLLQQRDALQTDPGDWMAAMFGPFFWCRCASLVLTITGQICLVSSCHLRQHGVLDEFRASTSVRSETRGSSTPCLISCQASARDSA
jgi:glycosyltransferase involved in cell wall biosynthesis